jgi:methyl-accepting chemotaxis protein
VTNAASQASGSSESLLQAVNQSSASTEVVSTSLEVLSTMTRSNEEHAVRAEALAAETHTSVTEGAKAVELLSSVMKRIQTSSNEVAKILKVIDEIAFQTNLLALNAAVEAARAGQAGLGFGVVAQEVRNLAQRSAEAARDTADKVERSVRSGAEAVKDSTMVTKRLADILQHSNQLNQLVAEIATSCRQQSSGIGDIDRALGRIEKAASTTSTNAQDSAQSSSRLNAEAVRLNRLADQFSTVMYGARSS